MGWIDVALAYYLLLSSESAKNENYSGRQNTMLKKKASQGAA